MYYNIGAKNTVIMSLYEMNNKIVTRVTDFADNTLPTSNGVAVLNMGENEKGD